MHAAPQRGGPRLERGTDHRHRLVGLGDLGDDERLPGQRRRAGSGRAGGPGEQVRPRRDASAAENALPLVDAYPVGYPDGPGRAQAIDVWRARVPYYRHGATPCAGVLVGLLRPAGRHHPVTQSAQRPEAHSAAPAAERPKLASMNGKSVRMSPAKTSCISTRLWNDAERGWQLVIRPPAIVTS